MVPARIRRSGLKGAPEQFAPRVDVQQSLEGAPGQECSVARVAHGLAASVELWCYLNKTPYYERSPSAVKKHATGSGNAPKPKMMQAARRLFPEQRITDDNQADALCLLHCFANA